VVAERIKIEETGISLRVWSLPPLSLPSILLLGHSHTEALEHAQQDRLKQGKASFALSTFALFRRYKPWITNEPSGPRLNDEIEIDIRRFAETAAPALIVGSFWGNQNYFACVANMPRRFDFILPREAELPLDPLAEIVPYNLMLAFARAHFFVSEMLIRLVQTVGGAPLSLLPAPPPVNNLGDIDGAQYDKTAAPLVDQYGFAPGLLRYKFWRLCYDVYQEKAAAANVSIVPIPDEAFDAQGFRRPEHYTGDWIHANRAYGELMLKQLDKRLAKT
jgi:hypothetical protein